MYRWHELHKENVAQKGNEKTTGVPAKQINPQSKSFRPNKPNFTNTHLLASLDDLYTTSFATLEPYQVVLGLLLFSVLGLLLHVLNFLALIYYYYLSLPREWMPTTKLEVCEYRVHVQVNHEEKRRSSTTSKLDKDPHQSSSSVIQASQFCVFIIKKTFYVALLRQWKCKTRSNCPDSYWYTFDSCG